MWMPEYYPSLASAIEVVETGTECFAFDHGWVQDLSSGEDGTR
jgi:hypothetical protein